MTPPPPVSAGLAYFIAAWCCMIISQVHSTDSANAKGVFALLWFGAAVFFYVSYLGAA